MRGSGSVLADIANAGRIEPGLPVGEILIAGDFAQLAGGTLAIDLDAPTPDLYDRLTILGEASLNGTLDLATTENYSAQIGDEFTILSAADTLNGAFAQLVHWNLPDGLIFDLVHEQKRDTSNVILRVIDAGACPGDLTGSGSVGVPDLLLLLSCWGDVAPGNECEDADLTDSGSVGVPDLLELLANWGMCPR